MEIFVTDKYAQFIVGNVDGNNGLAFLGSLPKPLLRRGFARHEASLFEDID
jgi:hypothetical protein